MDATYSDRQLRAFAEWLDQPLTPGTEHALERWLAEDPSHQETWETWQRINARAKQLQVVPGDVNADWATLRDELGFVRSPKARKRRTRRYAGADFYKQPEVVAILSMIVYSLFLYLLHMIRITVGF